MTDAHTLTAVQAGAYLHHLCLGSPDPTRLAEFYADVMDMAVERLSDKSYLTIGPRRALIFTSGTAKALSYAAFACRDRIGLQNLRGRAEMEGLQPEAYAGPLLEAGAFSVTDPDGNRIVFGITTLDRSAERRGMKAPLQHLTLATHDVDSIEAFYAGRLGFAVSDRVRDQSGAHMTCFMRSNHEHHTIACFRHKVQGIDHHSYEAGDCITLRDWCDRFANRRIPLIWGPGRHGPGNNLFAFVDDPDGNWIEISAELEVIFDRPAREWPHEERSLNLWGRGILRA
jgi:catechol-2,3-dioxygenase